MKKYLKLGLVPVTSILSLALIMTVFNLFEIDLNKIIITIMMIAITFISGFILGRNTTDKAYLKGLIYGAILSIVMFLLSFILLSNHSLYNIIYYIIIITSTTLGSMFKKKKK